MAFYCPACQGYGSLIIKASLELSPDSRSDEISVQILHCPRCGFKGVGIYEESRRGSLEGDSVDHRGYKISRQTWTRLVKSFKACPSPRNSLCNCEIHQELGKQDASGRWMGLDSLEISNRFEMSYLPGSNRG